MGFWWQEKPKKKIKCTCRKCGVEGESGYLAYRKEVLGLKEDPPPDMICLRCFFDELGYITSKDKSIDFSKKTTYQEDQKRLDRIMDIISEYVGDLSEGTPPNPPDLETCQAIFNLIELYNEIQRNTLAMHSMAKELKIIDENWYASSENWAEMEEEEIIEHFRKEVLEK